MCSQTRPVAWVRDARGSRSGFVQDASRFGCRKELQPNASSQSETLLPRRFLLRSCDSRLALPDTLVLVSRQLGRNHTALEQSIVLHPRRSSAEWIEIPAPSVHALSPRQTLWAAPSQSTPATEADGSPPYRAGRPSLHRTPLGFRLLPFQQRGSPHSRFSSCSTQVRRANC